LIATSSTTTMVDCINADIWIADSGASLHATNSLQGMFDLEACNIEITVGDGKMLKAIHKGKKKLEVLQNGPNKSNITVTLTNVHYVPGLVCNLFSLTSAMSNGGSITSNGLHLTINKGSCKITFDQVIKSANGHLLGIKTQPIKNDTAMAVMAKKARQIDINILHSRLGHANEAYTKATALSHGWKCTGRWIVCEYCALGKSKQKTLSKANTSPAESAGERLYLDISSIQATGLGGSKFWCLLVDELTKMKWSFFLKKKSDQVEKVVTFLKELKLQSSKMVKMIRCDNAGENQALSSACKKENLGISFEFTAPGTPQHNGVVERAFATLFGRTRAMMNEAKLPESLRKALWTECANTATDIDNVVVSNKISPHQAFHGKPPKYIDHMRIFGEMGVIKDHDGGFKSKLADKGTTVMFLGYAQDHSGDVFRFLKIKTMKVVLSRDVIWLNQLYYHYKNNFKMELQSVMVLESNSSELKSKLHTMDNQETTDPGTEQEGQVGEEEKSATSEESETTTDYRAKLRSSVKPPMELRRLDTFYNPTIRGVNFKDQAEFLFLSTETKTKEPATFNEAWYHPDSEEQAGWRDAIEKELNDMHLKRQIWDKMAIQDIPTGRKLIGSKWVFKKKKNGIYRARLCALGYNQVPGIDYTDNFAPVVNDITLRLVFLSWLVNPAWSARVYDVETAFLYGELEEPVYMKIPQGLDKFIGNLKPKTECLLLKKAMYGLVQAARQWWRKFISMLVDEFKFNKSQADACVLIREDEEGTIILCIYVDDALMVGDPRAIQKTVKQLRSKVSLKDVGPLSEYVGCTVVRDGDKKKLWMWQPDLITKLEEVFHDKINTLQVYKTPAAPGEIIMKAKDESEKVDEATHSLFRSGVGMLLYLVKFSRPEISNAVREMAKVNDGPTKAHMKSLYRLIKYVVDTRHHGLVMEPTETHQDNTWEMKAFCDSDYAGDKDGRKSISGFVIYIQGCLISWKSRSQKSVTLSSTEAEYVAISEMCAEIMFLKQVLEFLKIKVVLPIIVRVDNVGAIYLAQNAVSGPRMKHVDVRYHFVRDYIEDGIVKIVFVKSEDNDSDIYTKNLGEELFYKHSGKYIQALDDDGKGVGNAG
jgi:hypothetical protein